MKRFDDSKMHKDNWLSVLIGPFKFVIPALAYLILYPLMIAETSIEVVGAWSLIAAIVSFISVSDIGFSQLLTRDAGADRSAALRDVYADYLTARRAYVLLLLIFVAIFIAASDFLLAPLATVYPVNALIASVVLILIGGFIQLSGKLDAALLAARHDNYFVQIVMAITPALTYSAAIIGTLLKRPIEGLAVGTVLAGIATVAVYRFRLFRCHRELVSVEISLSAHDSFERFLSLTRRGWHLYSCSIGMMIRGPIYRVVIVSTVGLQAAAIFDIAMRLTQTVREVVATRFSVLFPSFAFLSRSGERAKTIELIQISLLVLLSFGSFLLCLLMGAVDPILTVWLSEYPRDLVPSTRILAIWHIITLANVPFWYLLQATHNESVAAFSVWAHTLAIMLVIPLSTLIDLDIVDLMVYWTATSVVTQGLIYFYVEKRLGLFWESVLSPRIVLLLLVVLVYSSSSYWLSSTTTDISRLAVYFVMTSITFTVFAALLLWKPVLRFINTSRSVAPLDAS